MQGERQAVTIRPAQPSDAAALSACMRRAYARYAERLSDLPDVAGGLAEEIEQHCVWVAEQDGSLLGGLVLVLEEERARLANLAVDPAASGQGLGRRLIETAEMACRARGLTHLHLTTHRAMPENQDLYRHLGWEESGRSGNKVFMTKQLMSTPSPAKSAREPRHTERHG
ncbi:MAG: GNAT family N-acetyltransferase [Kiloniellales bacterium]